jgi:serine-type D-Ala-D-Ala carboxypeptidase (penicillin-binding protein 5/6)
MRHARSLAVMLTSGALVVGFWTGSPHPAQANEPIPTPAPLVDISPTEPTSAEPSVVEPTLPAVDVTGGGRLGESGPVVDLTAGAAQLPKVKARTWVLADATTGEVLASKKAHKLRRPASTIKTLTALTLLPELDPQATWIGTAKAQNTYGSKVGIRKGREYTVDQLFYGLMLPSGNDAAIALAQANSSVKKTVEQMNDVAEGLQAYNTTAVNTSGLDAPDQFSTAYDLTLIARAALEREDFRRYATSKSAEFPNPRKKRKKPITIYNQNDLVMDDYRGAVGVKTGFTSKAGRTFIGAAERDGRTLIVALMGIREPSDEAARKLLNWGFKNRDRIIPIGELVEPLAEQPMSTTSTAVENSTGSSPAGDLPDEQLTVASQEPTLSSLSPSAWGWLAVFSALAIVVMGAVVRRIFSRRRRSFVS